MMVLNEDATYGYTDEQLHLYPTAVETELFSERFSSVLAQDLLYVTRTAMGRQLRAKGWTCPILPGAEIEAYAEKLAVTLAAKSQEALRLLKQHLVRNLADLVKELRQVETTSGAMEHPSQTVVEEMTSPTEHIQLSTPAENVLAIRLSATAGKQVGARELVAELGALFTRVRESGSYKAIVLASEDAGFLPGQAVAEDVMLDFQRLLVESEIPVVAALAGNAKGHGWLLSQLCDACVYTRTGVYSAAEIGQGQILRKTAATTFIYRLGKAAGQEILFTGADYSGEELERRVGTLLVAEQDQVLAKAVEVAKSWTRLPRTTLAVWKKHTAASLEEKMRDLPDTAEWGKAEEAPEQAPTVPIQIALRSKVVTAMAHPEGIVVVKMEDREAKNMFSEALLEGMREAFIHIEQTPAYKVVILTGYDSYFSCGGTKDTLLSIQAGKAKFTDFNVFQRPLDCKLPVIAAMQGHGIGAGWTLGMFADFVLVSEESRYVSPYMNYGFTPGAGATWVLADKMGQDLARESLLTGQQHSGRDWKDRGLRIPIVPRSDMIAAAMMLARQIARGSRQRLLDLKQQLTGPVYQPLKEAYQLELAMHEKTFKGQSDTLAQIHKNYQEIEETVLLETSASAAGVPTTSTQPAEIKPTANSLVDSDVLPALTASLKTLLANELLMRESDIDEDVQFVDLGLDSISGVTWVRKINEKYRTSIEATKVYSYPTLAQLSCYIKEEAEKLGTLLRQDTPVATANPVALGVGASSQSKMATKFAGEKLTSSRRRRTARFTSAPASQIPHAPHSVQPIAVIGMAGQFPQAKNLDEFWQNIAQGRNCITQVPPDRWDVNAYYQPGKIVAGKTNSQWAGAVEEYDRFDPLFFSISPTEAEYMDPQQRLLLQACWHTIENAGYNARALSGKKCGIFVGCTAGEYATLSQQQRLSAQGFTGNAMSILAGRISYFLNLQGPCLSIDTACSSSLVAIANACDSLISGDSDVALAGGVYVMAGPEMHIKTAQAGMLSPEGKCFTFDQRADGFVPGEGVGAVMFKRLADAQRDGDIIYGVIEGWGVNQDGKTNGITAPNPDSQTRLEQEVYDKYQIDPASIQLIEAHGTGTKLGDPIEVEGLKNAFKKYTQNKEYCALGSVKSNIGHCMPAAGVAGFIKLMLALQHKQVPPTINFEQLNEHIDLKDSPFYVNSQLQEWKLNGAERRRAAISSLGFSGTNAHIVVGEYLPSVEIKPLVTVITQNTKIIVPLSARTPEQLKQKAHDLSGFIRANASAVDLIEIAYTLQIGREAMEERMGLLVSSIEQLAEKLEAYATGEQGIEDVYQGQVRRNKENLSIISQDDDVKEAIVDKWIAQKKLPKLLDLWVKGLELDWNRFYGEIKPKRISLPTYPFAKERYWIDAAGDKKLAAPSVLHPLVHRNTSDLNEQSYSSMFTGEELFLADHRVRINGHGDQKVLPGVAYLEMARAAIEQAAPIQPQSSILELRNTVWLKPVAVTGQKQVSIALSTDDNDKIDYEIYSVEDEQEAVHCQGQAVFSHQSTPERLDVEQLKLQMESKLEAPYIYAMFARMGLNYGPAHQGITALYLGEKQVLAQLRLPAITATSQLEYVLHPSLMDSAMQASIGLLIDVNQVSSKPYVPFALESLSIMSACTREMAAWVRYSEGSTPGDRIIKLDIDLCDHQGNICVQMRGFAPRMLDGEPRPAHEKANHNSIRTKLNFIENGSSFNSTFYQKLIKDVLNREMSIDEAVELA
ncbi:MAG TPA: polyketide synthase [Verrucomicrobiae bacterium]|nr:polyketide synthase [Verrucomicrobiae bacterium]